MSRTDEAILSTKRAFNVCPICWMPLWTNGVHEERDKWGVVQMLAKSKPAFSVYDFAHKTHISRPVEAFGHHHLSKSSASNMESSHFVHYSMLGKNPIRKNVWTIGDGAAAGRHTIDGTRIKAKPVTVPHLENGLMRRATDLAGTDGFLNRMALGADYNSAAATKVCSRFFAGVFAGCSDCNGQMTIADCVRHAFDLAFGRDYEFKRGRTSVGTREGLEECLHWVMLTGVLTPGDVRFDHQECVFFLNHGDVRKPIWSLKYLTMWCALQVLFARWHISTMDCRTYHHGEYLFTGVMDFYLSVWLYALHFAHLTDGTVDQVEFEEFNFYYASCYPMYARQNLAYRGRANLSEVIMQGGLDGLDFYSSDWKRPNTQAVFVKQLNFILSKMQSAWNDHFEYLAYHIKTGFTDPSQASLNSFFQPPNELRTRRRWAEQQEPQMDGFLVNPVDYWFHFRHITLPRIAYLCERWTVTSGARL